MLGENVVCEDLLRVCAVGQLRVDMEVFYVFAREYRSFLDGEVQTDFLKALGWVPQTWQQTRPT
jgi:hypothetical protein